MKASSKVSSTKRSRTSKRFKRTMESQIVAMKKKSKRKRRMTMMRTNEWKLQVASTNRSVIKLYLSLRLINIIISTFSSLHWLILASNFTFC
jgi:hypothetical protein